MAQHIPPHFTFRVDPGCFDSTPEGSPALFDCTFDAGLLTLLDARVGSHPRGLFCISPTTGMTIVLRAPRGHETPYHPQAHDQASSTTQCQRTDSRDPLGSPLSTYCSPPLKSGKAPLRDVYDALWHRNTTIPIASLPAELLVYILRLANAEKLTEEGRRLTHPSRRRPLPLTISHVSRYWREVATTCPLLWADVDVSPPCSLHLIQLFLKRSCPCPIDLVLVVPTVTLGLMSCTLINKQADTLCDIVKPHIPRCQSIVVKGDFERLGPLLDSFLSMIETPHVPLLRRVVIQGNLDSDVDDENLENTPFSPILTRGVPALKELRLSGPMMSSCLAPLTQVTSLHLSVGDDSSSFRLSYSSFAAMLSACTNNLQTLALYDDVVWGPWPSTAGIGIIDLPALRSLQVYGTFTCVSDLLRLINCPELEELVIAPIVADDLYEFWKEEATRTGANSGHRCRYTRSPKFPRLTALAVSPVSVAGFDLLAIAAECFPTVERLAIPNPHHEALVKHFATMAGDAVGDSQEVLWPGLKALALRSVDQPCLRALEEVVEYRKMMGCPLESVYLDRASAVLSAVEADKMRRMVDVVELDVWKELRGDDTMHHLLHFVGREFH